MAELLTEAERRAVALTADLYNLIVREVIGDGPSRGGDQRELALHIHNLQNMILSQAAARAYPGMYRPLGGTLRRSDG